MRVAACMVAVGALLAAFASPPAAATVRMTAADRKAIGDVVDEFVKDAVLR
jgi:hypothetical protein